MTDEQRKELIEYMMELEYKLERPPEGTHRWDLLKWESEHRRVLAILSCHD